MTVIAPRPVPGKSQLAAEERRRQFVYAYLSLQRNITAAAKAIGVPDASADVWGARTIARPEVREMIDRITAETSAAAELTLTDTVRELRRVVRCDPRQFYRPDGTLKQPSEWDDDMAAAVASIKVEPRHKGGAKRGVYVGVATEIKFHPKNPAIDMALKYQGAYERDNIQRTPNLALQVVLVQPPGEPKL